MPAVLGRMIMPTVRRSEVIVFRYASWNGNVQAKPALKQLTVDEKGHFKYERDRSRDATMMNPQKLGDTPTRFLVRRLGHAFEVWPLLFLVGAWAVLFSYAVYISCNKIEIWFDRSNPVPPWNWERVRDKYWKYQTLAIDLYGTTHRRLEIMEKLQDQMLEASKKRQAEKRQAEKH